VLQKAIKNSADATQDERVDFVQVKKLTKNFWIM